MKSDGKVIHGLYKFVHVVCRVMERSSKYCMKGFLASCIKGFVVLVIIICSAYLELLRVQNTFMYSLSYCDNVRALLDTLLYGIPIALHNNR